MHKQKIEISSKALENNIEKLRKMAGYNKVDYNKEILAVVKANAYGHGLKEIGLLLIKNKVNWVGVDNIDEALELRKLFGKKLNILILGYTLNERLVEAIKNNISLTVYNQETIKILSKLKSKNINIHLKVESGMNRQGVLYKDLVFIVKLLKNTNINIEGISTHFADPENKNITQQQIDSFSLSLGKLKELGINPKFVHTSASYGFLFARHAPGNLLRIGRAMYGFATDFKPILTWKTIVAQIKRIDKGESVGYSHTWTASKPATIAILPIGYSDGLDRRLSNCGEVIIGGKLAPIIGRVAMNMCMVDITHISKVAIEDEVVIIGKQGTCSITADNIADKIGTISHEVLARLSPSIQKVII